MEIAVNINKKLWETILSEWKEFGRDPKASDADSIILGILSKHAIELIGQKAVDQVKRRFVIEELKLKKPKPKLDKFEEEEKKLRHELHRARKSDERRSKVRGRFNNIDNVKKSNNKNRPVRW